MLQQAGGAVGDQLRHGQSRIGSIDPFDMKQLSVDPKKFVGILGRNPNQDIRRPGESVSLQDFGNLLQFGGDIFQVALVYMEFHEGQQSVTQ